ncbi:MAG: FAD:protein FMN transferase [Chloroflexi bacterium]|nr:FAD:protein FMN transferase [Chloroflexota bacterium]
MVAETHSKLPRPVPAPPEWRTPAGLCRVDFPAMGTMVSLLLPTPRAASGTAAVRALFAGWEGTLSRFRPDSELSYLNRRAGETVAVGALLFEVIATALAAARASGGLYDPTLLRQIEGLGYDRSFESLPSHTTPAVTGTLRAGGWRGVYLEPASRRVTLPAGVGLDLGGIAKGMAVDAALARLAALGAAPAMVNAGGDLAVRGLPPDGDAWMVAIARREGGGDHLLPLHHGAVATSGVARRHWRQGAEARHHLLDPRTGLPAASGLWSVTVVAARCTQAEAAAKVAFVLGPGTGARFLDRQGLAGLFIGEDGRQRRAGAWPALMGDMEESDE